MTTIIGAPNTTIYIRDYAGVEQYSTNLTNWTNINTFPCTIINSNPSSGQELTIQLYTNIELINTSQYYIIGSDYITFNGNNKKATVVGVTNYPGMIQNGTSSSSGYSNVAIIDLGVETIGTCTLSATLTGWIGQGYFGNGANENLIRNCYSTGNILEYQGGIVGSLAGKSGSITILNCYSSGEISGIFAGGIIGSGGGQDSGTCIITNCFSTGSISGANTGGICGPFAGFSSGNCTISSCYSTGIISGENASGIAGYGAGDSGVCTISYCYSTGTMSGNYTGGICGYSAGVNGSCTITKCYSLGNIIGFESGGICATYAGNMGNCTITLSFSIGEIVGRNSGGIVGSNAGYGDTGNCYITNCYSNGNISGESAGGITGYRTSFDNGNCVITNCYSRGNITGTDSGGLCGAYSGAETASTRGLFLANCYSSGTGNGSNGYFGANPRLIVGNFLYAAYGAWSDVSASSQLYNIPVRNSSTNVTQGTTWTKYDINTLNTPWILTAYNEELYNPNTGSSIVNQVFTTGDSIITGDTHLIISVNSDTDYTDISINSSSGVITYTNKPEAIYDTLVIYYQTSGGLLYGYQTNHFIYTVSDISIYYYSSKTAALNKDSTQLLGYKAVTGNNDYQVGNINHGNLRRITKWKIASDSTGTSSRAKVYANGVYLNGSGNPNYYMYPAKFKRPLTANIALLQSLTIVSVWDGFEYYTQVANRYGFPRLEYSDYRTYYFQ